MKKEKRIYKQAAVNIVILALIIGIFLYLGIQFSKSFSVSVSTQRTQVLTDVKYTYLDGYVFRDETPIMQGESGVCDYLAKDGSRIGVGKTYGVFYPCSDDADNKQAELDSISDRIARLESKLSADGYVSELPAVEDKLKKSYYSYVNSLIDGDFSTADPSGELLLDALVDRSVITGKVGEVEDLTVVLKERKKAIIDGIASLGRSLVSDESFYLSYSTDGFENIYTPDKLSDITPEELRKIVSASPENFGDGVIGRAIHTPKWFFALPVTLDTVSGFFDGEGNAKIGERFEVTFLDEGGATVNMTLESVNLDDEGNGVMIFSSFDLSLSYRFLRSQSVKIKMSSVTGYRIPSNSLVEKDGESGVYILVGTVVEFRRVSVKAEGNGYYVVKTYEEDAVNSENADPSDKSSLYPYLNVNDMIITSGNDLYDGKLID